MLIVFSSSLFVVVHVKLDAVAVPGSPFKVTIPGPAASAAGEGISKGTAKQPAAFCVKSNPPSPSAKLVVTVDGPGDDAAPQVKPKGDGSWDCTYTPTAPGEYTIAAKLDGEHITGSPWKVTVDGAKERKGPSLGYENKIVGFYSTTTSSQVVRSNTTSVRLFVFGSVVKANFFLSLLFFRYYSHSLYHFLSFSFFLCLLFSVAAKSAGEQGSAHEELVCALDTSGKQHPNQSYHH